MKNIFSKKDSFEKFNNKLTEIINDIDLTSIVTSIYGDNNLYSFLQQKYNLPYYESMNEPEYIKDWFERNPSTSLKNVLFDCISWNYIQMNIKGAFAINLFLNTGHCILKLGMYQEPNKIRAVLKENQNNIHKFILYKEELKDERLSILEQYNFDE